MLDQGTRTGLLFKDMFEELVALSNSCEGSNWTAVALEELPLTEQIPILHRLDHSVKISVNFNVKGTKFLEWAAYLDSAQVKTSMNDI